MNSVMHPVAKKVLSNGLVVLARSVRHIPRVSINLWYGVGSKHEKSSEKGLAHLIEHMIFKGTQSKLSEVDIDTVTTKLSGYTNAFTSYDYTAYVFEFPTISWKQGLILLSDTMRNCRFEEQMLNSELSAVIQELKMYKDDYFDTLLSRLCAAIFTDHPYHYPVIGFKQDLWNLQRDALVAFYKKQYVPNNAALVVVGDIDPEEVFAEAEAQFGHIPIDPTFKKEEFYLSKDLIRQSVTLYRDVQQPQAAVSYVLPGAAEKNRFAFEVMAGILGKAKSSRLYAKIVDELELASELHCAIDQRQDATIMDITFQPNTVEDIQSIMTFIQKEIDQIAQQGVTQEELQRACKQVKVSLLSVLESSSEQAMLIGESYTVAGDENLIFKELVKDETGLAIEIQQLLKKYCSEMVRHEGKILPMTEEMVDHWGELQKISDKEDQRVLLGRTRKSSVEKPRYALTVSVPDFQTFAFARPTETFFAEKGLTVLFFNNPVVGKIDIVLTLAAKEYVDPEDKQGLYRFVCDLLLEGTKNYPGAQFAREVENLGMTLTIEPGVICLTMLKEDFIKGLSFIRELVMNGEFHKKTVEKVRSQILADLAMYWDEPQEFCHHLIRKKLYQNHPYSKDPHGTVQGIKTIELVDLEDFYKKHFTSYGATIAIVGDLTGYNTEQEVLRVFKDWNGQKRESSLFPILAPLQNEVINYPIKRDQIVLAFAARSIARLHEDYEKLLLFDQIFSGGSNGSMTSRLMMIREQTGLFYGIGGSLIAGCDEEPGMVLIKTTISLDRLEEAKEVLVKVIKNVIDSLTEAEIEQAKRAIIDGLVDNFSSSKKIAGAFLGIKRFDLPVDYFDTFQEKINTITLADVKKAAACVLTPDAMIMFQIGRV